VGNTVLVDGGVVGTVTCGRTVGGGGNVGGGDGTAARVATGGDVMAATVDVTRVMVVATGWAVATCGTGCDTPQYGHTGTKSARFPWQFVHCFKNVSPGTPWCASSTRPAPRMYMEIGRFVYHAIRPRSGYRRAPRAGQIF